MAMLIHADASKGVVIVKPASGALFTLDELQGYVGGFIEMAVRRADGKILWCNEEGKLQGLPVNVLATNLAMAAGLPDVIVGDAILTDVGEVD